MFPLKTFHCLGSLPFTAWEGAPVAPVLAQIRSHLQVQVSQKLAFLGGGNGKWLSMWEQRELLFLYVNLENCLLLQQDKIWASSCALMVVHEVVVVLKCFCCAWKTLYCCTESRRKSSLESWLWCLLMFRIYFLYPKSILFTEGK